MLRREALSISRTADPKDLGRLRSAWNELAYAERQYAPFLCHEWFELWLNHFISSNQLYVIGLHRQEKTLAIAPFFLHPVKIGPFKTKCVELIGNAYSPTRNFILGSAADEAKREYLNFFLCDIQGRSRDWDILNLGPFPEDSTILGLLKEALGDRKLKYMEELEHFNWELPIEHSSATEYISSLPKHLRSELRRRRRRLAETGKVEFIVKKDSRDLETYVEAYYDVYRKSWKKAEGIGPQFHRDLAKLAAERAWLRLGLLVVDGQPIAAQFRVVYGSTCIFLKTAYDEEFKQFAPGALLLEDMLRYLIDVDKVEWIDFGPGNEPYKELWAKRKRGMKRIMVFGNSLTAQAIYLLKAKLASTVHKYPKLDMLKAQLVNSFPPKRR